MENVKGVLGSGKNVGNASKTKVDDLSDRIIRNGSHLDETRNLKLNVKYRAGEYEYIYETDELGRIKEFAAEDLQNLSKYKKLENQWAKAIEDGKDVLVNVKVKYDDSSQYLVVLK